MKWIETITPKQAAEELGVPYHGWMREMDRAWISEDQRADMLRAMEAVSAKMAAERGITRQPLAVLSQSEISRRMSAI